VAVVCCDTSFLFSLYGRDTNTPAAMAEVQRLAQAISLTVLNEFELLNAIRFAQFRQVLSIAGATNIITAFEADIAGGRLVVEQANLAAIVTEARRLSGLHTASDGHRSFDLLHVAASSVLGASVFLSFDSNQRTLARAAGLRPRP
jgi:hypothetical protein